MQDPYYYADNAYKNYSYNPATNIFGHFTDYRDGAARSYVPAPRAYTLPDYETPPTYETPPPQQPYEAKVFYEPEKETPVEEPYVEEPAVDEPAPVYDEPVDTIERDYFVSKLLEYNFRKE